MEDFDWQFYVNEYADLKHIKTKKAAYNHWIQYGKQENRICKNNINIIKEYPKALVNYITNHNLQPYVHYYNFIPINTYNEILMACDIGINFKISNGGALSGSVMDFLSLNKPVITTADIIESLDIKNDFLVGFDMLKYDDWVSFHKKEGGYSDKLTVDICNSIINIMNNKTKNTISDIIAARRSNYITEFIKIFDLHMYSKLAIVTPFPPDNSGVADFTLSVIKDLLYKINHIDIFTDANVDKSLYTNLTFYKIDDINIKKDNYDKVIYVIGESHFHTKIIDNLKENGGACVVHDESLVGLYYKRLPASFVIDREKGFTNLCFDDILHAKPFVVHSKKLQKLIHKHYSIIPDYIPFRSYNNLIKLDNIAELRNKYHMNNVINIAFTGRLSMEKCPFQIIKVIENFKANNILCHVHFIGESYI
jgi:hypothetical protein